MFIIFGNGSHQSKLDDTEKRVCPHCGAVRQFSLFHQYRSSHVFFLPIFSSDHIFIDACNNCLQGDYLSMQEAEARIGREPISWFSRFGWTVPFIFIGGWWVIFALVFQLAKLIRH